MSAAEKAPAGGAAAKQKQYLSMDMVRSEVGALQGFCGEDSKKNSLREIRLLTDTDSENGRVPPWRANKGELAYISVQTLDKGVITICANKDGYYQNGGLRMDPNGEQHMDYEPNSDTYPTLALLIADISSAFNRNFDMSLDPGAFAEAMMAPEDTPAPAPAAAGRGRPNIPPVRLPQPPAERPGKRPARKKAVNRVKTPESKPSPRWQTLAEPVAYDVLVATTPRTAAVDAEDKDDGDDVGHGNGARSRASSARNNRAKTKSANIYSDSESEDEVIEPPPAGIRPADTFEHDRVAKLVRTMRISNQIATVLCLVHLLDMDLDAEVSQLAILEAGGVETLINLLTVNEPKCQLGALRVLKQVTASSHMQAAMEQLDGVQPLCDLVNTGADELKCLAAETLAHLAKFSRNRRAIRNYGGLPWLVSLLELDRLNQQEHTVDPIKLASSAAQALWSCAKSRKNTVALRDAQIVQRLAFILREYQRADDVLVPVVGIIQSCADDKPFRESVRSMNIITFLVRLLKTSKNIQLLTQCALAIFRCAEDEATQILVNKIDGGMDALIDLLGSTKSPQVNTDLLVAVTGAVWKCASYLPNVDLLNKNSQQPNQQPGAQQQGKEAITTLVSLLNHGTELVQVHAAGALRNCAAQPMSRKLILDAGGIPLLVAKLKDTNHDLLVNVAGAVGAAALDPACLAIISRDSGLQLLWSLLKSHNDHVITAAAWAICPCIHDGAGEEIRSFVSGRELVVSLLEKKNDEVRAAVCACIANIAKDEDNLAVMTDNNVIPRLADLTDTTNDHLRKHLADAIAQCSTWSDNKASFHRANKNQTVSNLVEYLTSRDREVHRSTARALYALSFDAKNCIKMHEAGVVAMLLDKVGANDGALQEAAAGCIGNIRRLAHANERAVARKSRSSTNRLDSAEA